MSIDGLVNVEVMVRCQREHLEVQSQLLLELFAEILILDAGACTLDRCLLAVIVRRDLFRIVIICDDIVLNSLIDRCRIFFPDLAGVLMCPQRLPSIDVNIVIDLLLQLSATGLISEFCHDILCRNCLPESFHCANSTDVFLDLPSVTQGIPVLIIRGDGDQ